MDEHPSILIPHTVGPETATDLESLLVDPDPPVGGGGEPVHEAIPGETGDAVARDAGEPVPASAVTAARRPAETDAAVGDAEVALTFRFGGDRLAAAGNLRWIAAISAGVDHYDLERLAERSVALTNAAGVHAEPIGEQAIGYLLAFERGFHRSLRNQVEGRWQRVRGGELRGKTLGVVGVGAIGTRVAELGQAFGMEVVGTKRDTGDVPDAVDEIHPPAETYDLFLRADHVVVACPLTDETRGLVGSDELRAMDDEGVLVNVARGAVVDEDALVRTLQRDAIGGAALDVFETEPLPAESPLWDLPDAVVTPHMAGSTPHYLDRAAAIFRANYRRFRADGPAALVNRIR